jgi:hypothetical protein
MMPLIVSCPIELAEDARHLAMHLAASAGLAPESIGLAFQNPFWTAPDASTHAVMAMRVSDGFLAAAAFATPVPAYDPDTGIDSLAAEAARQALAIWFAPSDGSPPGPLPLARADQVTALVGLPFDDAAPAMGLTRIPDDD